jgi:hypothetical protein
MSSTDFFDDDLIRQREQTKRIKMGPADEAVETVSSGGVDDVPVRPVSDFNLTRMARHRKTVEDQSTVASQELDRLKKRQEQVEHEKRELEDLRRKHDEYERGKRDIVDHLKRNLVSLERQEVESQRLAEVLGETRKRFKSMVADIEGINEDSWPEDQIRNELTRGAGIIEDARMEFNKALAKIEAVRGSASTPAAAPAPVLYDEHSHGHEADRGFGYWVKVGFAVSLPIVLTLIVLVGVYLFLQSNGLI